MLQSNGESPKADDALRLDNQLCFALHWASRAFAGAYGETLAERDITYTQYLVLICLLETDGLTIGALGERLALDSGTVTPVVKRLEARGLAERRRSRVDERKVEVRLTPEGRRLEALASRARRRVMAALEMDEREIASLRVALLGIAERLSEPRDGR